MKTNLRFEILLLVLSVLFFVFALYVFATDPLEARVESEMVIHAAVVEEFGVVCFVTPDFQAIDCMPVNETAVGR